MDTPLGNPVLVDDKFLQTLFEHVMNDTELGSEFQNSCWDLMEKMAGDLVPKQMGEEFYRGMISALISLDRMNDWTISKEHTSRVIEEFIRLVAKHIMAERGLNVAKEAS